MEGEHLPCMVPAKAISEPTDTIHPKAQTGDHSGRTRRGVPGAVWPETPSFCRSAWLGTREPRTPVLAPRKPPLCRVRRHRTPSAGRFEHFSPGTQVEWRKSEKGREGCSVSLLCLPISGSAEPKSSLHEGSQVETLKGGTDLLTQPNRTEALSAHFTLSFSLSSPSTPILLRWLRLRGNRIENTAFVLCLQEGSAALSTHSSWSELPCGL